MSELVPRAEQRWWPGTILLGPLPRLGLLVVLVLLVIDPESGMGFELCAFRRMTGGPCPGCGMTRSGANLLRGHVGRAIDYHPFGVVLLPVLIGLCAFSLLPFAVRRSATGRLMSRQRVLNILVAVFVFAFVAYGLVRWVAVMNGAMAFPPP
jgi:hypothetical protein